MFSGEFLSLIMWLKTHLKICLKMKRLAMYSEGLSIHEVTMKKSTSLSEKQKKTIRIISDEIYHIN